MGSVNRMTTWRRMQKLGITSDTIDTWAFHRAFDPSVSYRLLCKYHDLRNVLVTHNIDTVEELDNLLGERKNG